MLKPIRAFDFEYTFNQTQLPITFSDNLFITTSLNATLNFTHQNFTSSTSLVNLLNISTYNLTFTITLPNLSVNNHSTYFTIKKTINSTDTFNNISLLFKIQSNQSNASFFSVGFNEYSAEFCDTTLPFNSHLVTSITLTHDINPICDSFLSCPSIIYPTESSVRINISIPKKTSPSTYKKIANFGSNLGNITFHFKINECFIDVSQFCGNVTTVEQLVDCQAVLLEELKKINRTTVVNITHIEYVNNTETIIEKVLPVNNETTDLLKSMREISSSWRTIQSENQRLIKENKDINDAYSQNLITIQQELAKTNSEMDIRVKQTFLDLYLENQNLTLTNEQIEKKSWSKGRVVLSILGIFSLIGLILGFFKLKREMIY